MIRYFTFLMIGLCAVLQSCDNYLDVKPRSNLVVPETLDDMEQLLDDGALFGAYPELLELQADDFYFEPDYWNSSSMYPVDHSAYIWAKDIYGTTESHQAWSDQYVKIFYTNAVLDGLGKIERTATNATRYDQIKGTALFLKAETVCLLAQLFAKVYDSQTADIDLGIPIPISANVNEKLTRPSNQFTFDFIINSLKEAEKLLLPVADFSRPSKPAANAMLARVYLYMGYYDKALEHSEKSLMDFNDIIDLNDENIRGYRTTILSRVISPSNNIINEYATATLIDTFLMDYYVKNDLRRKYFFKEIAPTKYVKRSYNNLVVYCFSGLDGDEQYIIRAECYARAGKVDLALTDLNHLLEKRFASGTYIPYASTDKNEVLNWVLEERRKELVFRGLRWSDLKRLNRDGTNMTLKRVLGDQVFTLPPNDPKWILPIPNDEIKISNLPQNER